MILNGEAISQLVEVNPLLGTEDFIVRSNTNNLRLNYSTLLTKISSDLTISNVLTTQGDIVYYNSGSNDRLPIGTTNQFLRVGSGGSPEWQTVQILEDPTQNNGDLIIKDAGLLSSLPIGSIGSILTVGASNLPEWSSTSLYSDPLTTNGDLVIRSGGTTTRLPAGSENQVLTISLGEPVWASPSPSILSSNGDLLTYNSGDSAISIGTTGQFLRVNGGLPSWETVSLFTDPLTTNGDLVVRSGGTTTRLPLGSSGQVLSSNGSNSVWEDIPNILSIDDLLPISPTASSPGAGQDEQVLYWNDSNSLYELKDVTGGTYTPVITNTTNIDSVTPNGFKFTRIDNIVSVSGLLVIDATSDTTLTEFEVSLPIASNFSNNYELTGSLGINSPTNSELVLSILGNTSNDTASITFESFTTSAFNCVVSFSYEVI